MAKEAVKMTEQEINEGSIIIKADAQLGTIDDNFALLEVEITKQMAKYTGLKFDDKSIVEAKATRAELNKMITVIEEKRKTIKKKWNDPYIAFETRVKKIIAIIQGPMSEIDTQLAEYEERRRNEKQEAIDAEISAQLAVVPWRADFVKKLGIQFDPRWLNATMSLNKVITDIDAQIKQIISDGTTIERLAKDDMEMQEELLEHYSESRDLASTMARMAQINERKERARKAEEEAKALEEAARKAAEANKEATEEIIPDEKLSMPEQPIQQPSLDEQESPNVVKFPEPAVSEGEAVFETTFMVEVNRSQASALVVFLRSQDIKYKLISNKKKENENDLSETFTK